MMIMTNNISSITVVLATFLAYYLLTVSCFQPMLFIPVHRSVSFSLQPTCRGYRTRCNTSFLTKTDNDPYSKYSHQIAIPLHDSSELHTALHSIQTSLVRDCPRLIRACIMPAVLRLPLLYVDGNSFLGSGVMGSESEHNNIDTVLQQVVHDAIREVVYGDSETERISSIDSVVMESLTVKMDKSILIPFRGLELQGDDNSVLYAVGNDVNDKSNRKAFKRIDDSYKDDDGENVYIVDDWSDASNTKPKGPSGSQILEKLVYKIQYDLESKYGLQTCWPLDKPQGEEIVYDEEDPLVTSLKQKRRKWRPRVPFVRLPPDFYQDLQCDTDKNNKSNENEIEVPSRIDMGFDGISPSFWYEAWGGEDIISPPGVRMRSVAIYRRMVPGGGESETSFYVPTSSGGPAFWNGDANRAIGFGGFGDKKNGNTMELPDGDAKIMARERREEAKAMERLGEVESRAEREWDEGKARWIKEMNEGYINSEMDTSLVDESSSHNHFHDTGSVSVVGDAAYSIFDKNSNATFPTEESSKMVNRQIQNETSQSSAQSQLSAVEPQRKLPNFEDNPVFQRLWRGESQVTTQGQNTALALDGTPPTIDETLPPYPSNAHFVGAWRVVSSPLGTDDASIGNNMDSKSSDNFILRVDGQVMGGPILDAQYQHKAAGGKWKMFQAIRKPAKSQSGSTLESSPVTQTRLRIQLLVPPEKDRSLIMEGEVTRLVMPGTGDEASTSSRDGWMMANGGMLNGMLQSIEDTDSRQEVNRGEGLLCCSGEAWMEDTNGGTHRRKLGLFTLMKLKAIDRNNLIYTVDVSRKPRGDRFNATDIQNE